MRDGGWADRFIAAGGLWRHDGAASRPHALLTSGKHSDGFVNGSVLMQHAGLLSDVARDWADVINARPGPRPDWIFGSAFGAITLAFELARQVGCRAGFTEPVDGVLALKRFHVTEGERVIVVEDTITTGGSTKATIAALETAGAVIAPEIYLLVDRTDGQVLAPRMIHAAARIRVQAWDADDCPLCADGSAAIRPKGNWAALTEQG